MYTCKLGYYGKLPVSTEFIRCQASGSEMDELDQWIREGMYHAKTNLGPTWSTNFAQAGPWRFLYLPRQGSQFLTGILMPSHDQAGREFPFLLYLLLDKEEFHHIPWCAPMHFKEFLARSHRLLTDVSGESNLDRLQFRLQALLPVEDPEVSPLDTRYHATLQDRRMRDHWVDLFGDNADARYQVVESLRRRSSGLVSLEEQQLTTLPLLSSAPEETYDLPFWMDLIASVSGQKVDAAILFWNRSPTKSKPTLTVSLNRAPSFLLLRLIRQETCQTEQPVTHEPVYVLNEGGHALLDDQDMTLETFLHQASSLRPSIKDTQAPCGNITQSEQ
jgi:type VI secretion system protein ImpM